METEKNETELQIWQTKSMAWKNTSEESANILDLMIKGMARNSDEIPAQLVEPLDNILMISSDIEVFAIFSTLLIPH